MATEFVTGIAQGKDSFSVGKEAAQKALKKMRGEEINLSIVFCSSEYNYAEVVKGIKEVTNNASLIGCSSAGEFTEEQVSKKSVCCALISSDSHKFFLGMGKGLQEDEVATINQAVKEFPKTVKDYPHLSCIELIDGLRGKGEETTLLVSNILGSVSRLAGGAAGDDLKFEETKVFLNDRVETNAVILGLIASKTPVGIGVKHGHKPFSPSLNVTKSEGCILYELDNRPALEVWKEYTRKKAKEIYNIDVDKLTEPSDIGSYLIKYEAGLLAGTEYKVRVPLSVNADDSLNFACNIPEGAVIRIMESPKEEQIASARKAAELAVASSKGNKIVGAIVFDCVCRALILGDEFSKAVEAIKEVIGKDVPLIGFETYGEIAMELGQLSGFHNTTTSILLLTEK